MAWDIVIISAKGKSTPLGDRADVVARFAAALPGLRLAAPPVPPPDVLEQMPEVVRNNLLTELQADFEAPEILIQFYTHNEPVIRFVCAEVRGDGNPVPALAALCVPNGWAVLDSADKSLVDLSANASPEWDRFRAWRNKAFGQSSESGSASE